jgi:hypothetical protein
VEEKEEGKEVLSECRVRRICKRRVEKSFEWENR